MNTEESIQPHEIKVLVAEDNSIARKGLRILLASLPEVRIVAEATTIPEALAAYDLHNPHVAILDIQMPGGTGLDALRHIRSHSQDCLVIINSGSVRDVYEAICREAGADYYFEKGRDHERILGAIAAFSLDHRG
jgi:DNA-binding NarL/FixJ family response regulator